MVEINHFRARNFFANPWFKYVQASEPKEAKNEDKAARAVDRFDGFRVRGFYDTLSKVRSFAGCADGAVGVLAGSSPSRGRSRPRGSGGWPSLRNRTTGLRLWLLRLLSIRLRPLRLLRPKLLCRRRIYRRGPVVSLGPRCLVLESRICG